MRGWRSDQSVSPSRKETDFFRSDCNKLPKVFVSAMGFHENPVGQVRFMKWCRQPVFMINVTCICFVSTYNEFGNLQIVGEFDEPL